MTIECDMLFKIEPTLSTTNLDETLNADARLRKKFTWTNGTGVDQIDRFYLSYHSVAVTNVINTDLADSSEGIFGKEADMAELVGFIVIAGAPDGTAASDGAVWTIGPGASNGFAGFFGSADCETAALGAG